MKISTLFVCVLVGLMLCNCSVYMAARQPDAKNLDVINVGMPRSVVLAEFGGPVSTEVKDGQKCDIFVFTQGYSKGAKAGRAVFHALADVFTWGLWEVAGTPTEATFDGNKLSYQVCYDSSDKVKKVIPLNQKSRDELNPPTPLIPSIPIQ